MADDYNEVLQRVLVEHGCWTAADVGIARLLVDQLLAVDPDADRIVKLRAALPAPVPAAAAGPKPDLKRLTNDELSALDQLMAKACDETREAFRLDAPEERSPRFWDVMRIAEWLDAVPEGRALDAGEQAVLCGMICALVADKVLPSTLFARYGSQAPAGGAGGNGADPAGNGSDGGAAVLRPPRGATRGLRAWSRSSRRTSCRSPRRLSSGRRGWQRTTGRGRRRTATRFCRQGAYS